METILRELGGGARGPAVPADSASEPPSSTVPILFDHDSARISSTSLAQVESVAQALADPSLAGVRFRIEGHTDQNGGASYNQALSERRAAAVLRQLVQAHGIEPSRLVSRGYGESRPLPGVSQESESGWRQNRRVVVVRLDREAADSAAAAPPRNPPAADPSTTGATSRRDSVTIRVHTRGSSTEQVLEAGGILRTNDRYRVSFEPARDSHVYMFQFDAGGKSQQLFPNAELGPTENPVSGGQRYNVPETSTWLTLSGASGEETIIAIAADRPIDNPAAAAAKALAGSSRGPLPPGAGGDPQPGAKLSLSRFTFQHR